MTLLGRLRSLCDARYSIRIRGAFGIVYGLPVIWFDQFEVSIVPGDPDRPLGLTLSGLLAINFALIVLTLLRVFQ